MMSVEKVTFLLNNYMRNHVGMVIEDIISVLHLYYYIESGIVYVCGLQVFSEFGMNADDQPKGKEFKCLKWSNINNVSSIKCGYNFTIFQVNNNEYYSCGSNSFGQCGLNHNQFEVTTPTKITHFIDNNIIIRDVCVTVVSKASHFVDNHGLLYCCGKSVNPPYITSETDKNIKLVEYFADNNIKIKYEIWIFM